jgi:hypothetical protein
MWESRSDFQPVPLGLKESLLLVFTFATRVCQIRFRLNSDSESCVWLPTLVRLAHLRKACIDLP